MKLKKILGSVGRHGLTFGGGAMTAGMFGSKFTPIGGVLTGVGVLLSTLDKQQQEKRESEALMTMPPNAKLPLPTTYKPVIDLSIAELRAELERRLPK